MILGGELPHMQPRFDLRPYLSSPILQQQQSGSWRRRHKLEVSSEPSRPGAVRPLMARTRPCLPQLVSRSILEADSPRGLAIALFPEFHDEDALGWPCHLLQCALSIGAGLGGIRAHLTQKQPPPP